MSLVTGLGWRLLPSGGGGVRGGGPCPARLAGTSFSRGFK
jgi:hypothetical protein